MGVGLGLLMRADPLTSAVGVPFDTVAPRAASAIPFNGGTGFFVSADGTFIAPYHVIGDCPHPALQTPDGLVVGRVLAASAILDIAVARGSVRSPSHAVFSEVRRSFLAQQLTVVRFRGCGGLSSRTAIDAASLPLLHRGPNMLALLAESPIQGGNSGSPVLDQNGAVVGMVTARAAAEARTGFAVDGETLTGFLIGAGIDVDVETNRPPVGDGLAGAIAAQYTFPVVCLY